MMYQQIKFIIYLTNDCHIIRLIFISVFLNYFELQKVIAMSLTKMKAQTQSRMSQEKRNADRKRNLIILIEKYLLTLGCIDSVTKIQQQTQITLEKWDTADNIDLFMIFLDYEQYYEARFGKPPKVVKKVDDTSSYEQLKKMALRQKQLNASINTTGTTAKVAEGGQSAPPSKPNFKKKQSVSDKEKSQKSIQTKPQIQVQGNALNSNKKKQEDNEHYDVRVQKGIPDYSDVPEYRELAAYLQRDILVQNPDVRFQDIIGLDHAKTLIMEAVTLPLKYPQCFVGITEAWRGILLYGPPGTGKTMLAKAVATQCKTTFFNISASSVVSKWRGQSEKLIRILFELARFYQPSTIFIDQIDSIMSQRSSQGNQHQGSRRMKTQLLIQMEGLLKKNEKVFVLAASNIPWDLDDAMLRRLQKRILVDLPNHAARKNMVEKLLSDRSVPDIDYASIADRLQGYSGSDIRLVCKQAAMRPLRKLLFHLQGIDVGQQPKSSKFKPRPKEEVIMPDQVSMADLQASLKCVKKSPGLDIKRYEQWNNAHGSA